MGVCIVLFRPRQVSVSMNLAGLYGGCARRDERTELEDKSCAARALGSRDIQNHLQLLRAQHGNLHSGQLLQRRQYPCDPV